MKYGKMMALVMCTLMILQISYAQELGTEQTLKANKEFRVVFLGQEPAPVEPGEFVELRWKVENFGNFAIKDAVFEIETEYPFSIDSESNRKKNVGTVSPGQTGDNGIILEWRVRVDENAIQGDEEIRLKYNVGSASVNLDPYKISIRSRDIILAVENVEIQPQRPRPGEIANITITIKNLADSSVGDVKVRLTPQNNAFVAVGSSNEKVIKRLSGRDQETINFIMAVDAKALSKVHEVPLTIEFKDNFNEKFSINTAFGIPIDSPPDYTINIEDTKVYRNGDTGDIVLSISNTGVSDINFVTLQLMPNEYYEVVTTDKFYLGNLESDDFETAEYRIHVKKGDGEIPIEATLTYKDSFNREYNKKVNLPLKIYSTSEAKKYGLIEGGSGIGYIIFLLLVLIISYFIFKKKTKSKNYKDVIKKIKEYL